MASGRGVSGLLRRFIDANVRLSRSTEARFDLPSDKELWGMFADTATTLIDNVDDGAVVLDLGGGRRCVYHHAVKPRGRLRLVAVDISAEELAANNDVDETLIANVAESLPIEDSSVDLIFSRALLEHVDGVPAAISEMGRVLKPGGVALHMVPSRYSLFGTAARLLPFDQLLRLTHYLMPSSRGTVEFPVKYDHCWPQALEAEFKKSGFSEVVTTITWAQSGYFETIYPLFLLCTAYEWCVRKLGLRKLAAYTVVKAVR